MRMFKQIERNKGLQSGAVLLLWVVGLLLSPQGLKGAESVPEKDLGLELYFTANGLYNRQLYELAAQEYAAFLKSYPDHEKTTKARLGLALSTFGQGKYEVVEPLLAKLSSSVVGGERIQVHLMWGQTLLMLERAKDAATAFERVLAESDSASKERLLAGLVEARYQDKDWPEVLKWSRALVRLAPRGNHTWRANFQGAQALFESKQYEQAAEAFEALAAVSENSPLRQQIEFLLAESLRETDNLNGAAQSYDRAVRIGGVFSADSLFRLGYIRFHQGRFNDATKALSQLLRDHEEYPSAPQAAVFIGRAYFETEEYDRAEAIFRDLSRSPKMEAEAKLWRGKVLLRQEKFPEVEALLSRVIELESRFKADLLYDYGTALLGAEKFGAAAAAFTGMADEFPQNAMASEAIRLGALCLHRAGEYVESLAQCDRFLVVGPDDAEQVAFLRGENFFFLKRLDESIEAYRAFLSRYENSKESVSARMRLGVIFHGQKRWQEAVEAFLKLSGATGTTGALFAQSDFLLGDAYYELEQWDQAIKQFEAFADERPGELNADTALLKAALACDRKRDSDHAVSSLTKMISEYPDSGHIAPALVELGRLQYQNDDLEAARMALQRVVRRHGDSQVRPQADYYLGWVALTEKELSEAIQHFGRVVEAGPAHPLAADACLQQGLLLVETKEYETAKQVLDEFSRSYPAEQRRDQARFYSGIASLGEKDWDDALGRFEGVIEEFPNSAFCERALYESAWAEKNAGRSSRAKSHYEALSTRFRNTPLAHSAVFELAELEFDEKEFASVRNRLSQLLPALNDKGLRARVLYRLAWAQLSEGEVLAAAQSFETMLTEAPPENLVAMASFQAGEARLTLKEFAQAQEHFAQALLADGNEEIVDRILLRLGETQGLVGRWREAEASYGRLVGDFPDSPLGRRAQLGIGWSQENQERFEAAIASYRKVVVGGRRDETSARCQFQIGECLLAEKKLDEAIREFIHLEVNYGYPDWSSKALLEIGRALEAKGDPDGALGRYREVLDKYPETAAAEVAMDIVGNLSGAKN